MSERLPLVTLDLKNFQGIYTKSSPDVLNPEQLEIAENVDFFQLYGAAAKLKGNRRVLSSIYQELSVTKPISWVGFYKQPDLDGSILRHTLIAAGTTIQRVANNGTLTSLATGRTSGLYHSSDIINQFMLISNQDPDLVGRGDPMVKYDGNEITRWGVIPPGSQTDGSTVAQGDIVERFSNAAQFGAISGTALSDEATVTWDGEAIKVDKTGTLAQAAGFYGPITVPGAPNTAVANRVTIRVYIPRGQLKNFRQTTTDADQAMTFRFSSQTGSNPHEPTADYYEYYIKVGQLSEGWNFLNFSFNAAPTGSTGSSNGTFSGTVNTIQFRIFSTTAATTISGIRYSYLVFYDQGTPSGTPSATGGLLGAGAYSYRVTFVNKYGTESNAGPASATITTTGSNTSKIDLASIPISNDPNVIARKIYRTVAGGTLYLQLAQINDNITTTYSDIIADGSLSTVTAPQSGDFSSDNGPPPQGGIVKVWKKTVFIAGDPQNPTTLYFSNDDAPEAFALINTFEFDGKITGIYQTYSGLVVETENSKWQILGDNPDFAIDKIIDGMGNVGRRACGTARMVGWSVDRDGMRLYDLSDTKKISEPIRNKYDDSINKQNIELIHTVHSSRRNAIIQFNPDSNGEYTSIYMYQYSIDDVRTGWWSTINIPTAANLNFLHCVEIEDDDGTKLLYAAADDGMLYELFNESATNWVDAAGTSYPMVMKLQTPYIRVMGMEGAQSATGQTGRVHPRLVELRTQGDATDYSVILDTAKGISPTAPLDTQTISMEFAAGDSLLRYPTRELTPAEYVRLTIMNEDLNVTTTLLAARVYLAARAGQFPVISGI